MSIETDNTGKIIEGLCSGKIVVLPTDTVFGLSCNAYNLDSVKKIYQIKNRPFSLPLSIAVKNKEFIYKITKNVSKKAIDVIDKYFPGQVTIILEKNELIPDIVTSGSNYVGIRIPNDTNLLYILDKLDFPIVLTSANLHGYDNCKNINEVKNQLGSQVDFIYNVSSTVCSESTIVKVINDHLEIIRQGCVLVK